MNLNHDVTIFTGAITLLKDCQVVLQSSEVRGVIMGGWNALLYKAPERFHPGTFDVDILLPPTLGRFQAEALIREFLANGFSQSAKHAFQLLREVKLKDHKFTFNVDLLHPRLEGKYPEMFLDLMSYDIPLSDFDRATINFAKSIMLPGVDKVIWERHSERTLFLDEANCRHEVTGLFPDPIAFICSKALALGAAKRPRDAYDIFITLEGQGVEQCAADLYEMAKTNHIARRCLENLRDFMQETTESGGTKKQFLSSFEANAFFKKLDDEDKTCCKNEAQQIIDKFLSSTSRYPKGMVAFD